MERQIGLNEDILRHLTIKLEELDAEPSPLMQNKQNRDRRYESLLNENYGPYEGEGERE